MMSERTTADGTLNPQTWFSRRKPSVVWLAPAVFLEFFCLMGPAAFFQEEMKNRHGAAAVELITYALGIRGIMSFFASPAIGALSDHWGRTPLFGIHLLTVTSFAVPLAIMPGGTGRVDIALFLFAFLGMTGSPFAYSFSYCSDLAPPGASSEVQTMIARMLAISFTPSFIIAPTACKFLFRFLRTRLAWSVLVGLGVANALYIWILLPESRKPSQGDFSDSGDSRTLSLEERPPALSRNPLQYFRLLRCSSPAGAESARFLRLISGVLFFLYVAKWTVLSVVILYAEEHFGWQAGNAGMLLSMWGLSQFLSMTAVGVFGKGLDERTISWIGLVSGFFGILICFFTIYGWMLWFGLAIGAISMISLTALTSYASCLVHASMHGEVQGLTSTMICLTEIVGPPIFGALMSAALKQRGAQWWFVNLPFGIGVFCVVTAMVFMSRLPHVSQAMHLCGRTLDEAAVEQDQFQTCATNRILPSKH